MRYVNGQRLPPFLQGSPAADGSGLDAVVFDSLRFDLANPLPCHLEDAPDFFQRICIAVAKAVSQLDDFAFAVCQRLQNNVDLVFQHFRSRVTHRAVFASIF
jgi:signal transduction protein with GAF and PtsI domain